MQQALKACSDAAKINNVRNTLSLQKMKYTHTKRPSPSERTKERIFDVRLVRRTMGRVEKKE